MTQVPFKVHLQRHKEPTYHRFSGKYSFDEFQSLIAHLWGSAPKSLVVEYQDDEGDRIRVSSQLEWEECIRIWTAHGGNAPIRIFARRHKREDKPSASQEESKDDSKEQTDAPTSPTPIPSLPPLQLPRNPLNVEPDPQAEDHVLKEVLPMVAFECPEHKAIIDLLSLVFNCDATAILTRGVNGCPSSAVRRSVNPEDPSEVHLDIDRQAIFRRAVDTANKALDEREYIRAERILRAALFVFPDNMLLEYNLSCALSLQGFVEDALVMLSLAMDHGYDNIEHIKSDPDLVQLREHPGFQTLLPTPPAPVVALTPVVKEAAVPVPPPVPVDVVQSEPSAPIVSSLPPTVTSPAPAEPLQPTPKQQPELLPSVPPAVRTLMSVFPGLSVAEAKSVLQRAGGNVAIAVNSLLPR